AGSGTPGAVAPAGGASPAPGRRPFAPPPLWSTAAAVTSSTATRTMRRVVARRGRRSRPTGSNLAGCGARALMAWHVRRRIRPEPGRRTATVDNREGCGQPRPRADDTGMGRPPEWASAVGWGVTYTAAGSPGSRVAGQPGRRV